MKHYMKLNPEPFEKIASGKKTIELRLYDEKRKLIKPGDEIIFKHISFADCGYEEKEITGTNHLDMNRYYSEEKQRQFGVVGIKFSKSKISLSEVHVPYDEVKAYIAEFVIKSAKQIPEVNEWYMY